MFGKNTLLSVSLAAVVAAAPARNEARQVPGYTDADAPYKSTQSIGPLTDLATTFGPDSQVSAIPTSPPTAGAFPNNPAPPRVSSDLTGATSHGPYSGTPTTTGAEQAPSTLAASIGTLPPNPTATYYNADGKLQNPMPAPYTPAGKIYSTLSPCIANST